MTKKDRIAVFISIVLPFFAASIVKSRETATGFLIGFAFVVVYWGYRFIQNDISFLQRNPKTAKDKSIGGIATDVVRTFKTTNKADELLKWNELLEKGAITQEEYDKAKRDLLG
jgi:hypothetical protein